MKTNFIKLFGSIMIVSLFILLAFGSEDSSDESTDSKRIKTEKKLILEEFKEGKEYEFHEYSIVTDCNDPTIRKINVIDDKTAEIYVWHKGCPNNVIDEEKLIYNYRIDSSRLWKHEYSWLETDREVIILENDAAGYYNRYRHLAKRYMLTNAYNNDDFIEIRLFEQLNLEEYPNRNSEFTSVGGLANY